MNKLFLMVIGWGVTTVILGTVYAAGQQVLRQSANDPQIQMAEDYSGLPLNGKIDLATSLAPFVVVYDTNGQPVSGTGYLNNALPQLPAGVIAYTREHGEDRVTWQPQDGVRIASVITHKNNQFVLAGRSLRETEVRAQKLLELVAMGWIVAMAGLTFGLLVVPSSRKK